MTFIYVTGIAGSGKSTIQKELQRQGYDAHDVDEPGIGAAHNKQTGMVVRIPSVEKRSPTWFDDHSWKMQREAIETLKAKSLHHLVFLCAKAANENEVWDLFDQVICLDIDNNTLRRRIAAREDNDFGKSEHELKRILLANESSREKYERVGVKIVDASRPIEQVVIEVIATSSRAAG